jgi:hypothetical protein
MDPKSFQLNEKFMHKTFMDVVVSEKVFALTYDSLLCVYSL